MHLIRGNLLKKPFGHIVIYGLVNAGMNPTFLGNGRGKVVNAGGMNTIFFLPYYFIPGNYRC